jgi:hypothetical protein
LLGYCFQVIVRRQNTGGAFCAPPRHAGETVGGVSDECEVVRDGLRPDTELLAHAVRVSRDAAATVELNDRIAVNTLREVLVGRADQYAFDLRICGRPARSSGETVIGLLIDHRPHHNAQGAQRVL